NAVNRQPAAASRCVPSPPLQYSITSATRPRDPKSASLLVIILRACSCPLLRAAFARHHAPQSQTSRDCGSIVRARGASGYACPAGPTATLHSRPPQVFPTEPRITDGAQTALQTLG